jgi:SAM-dependent methyltransferase
MSAPDDRPLWAMTQAALHLPAMMTALRRGLLEALGRESRSIADLARRTATSERGTGILLRFLQSAGFARIEGELASLTPVARTYLLRDSDAYWGGMFERLGSIDLTVERLERACADAGSDLWAEHAVEPSLARSFAEGAHCRARYASQRLAREPFLDGVASLLDVGGGKGTYAVEFASLRPALRVTLLDFAPACQLANEWIESAGVASRVHTAALDMFEDPWPEPQDAVWFSDIFHDWPYERCLELARSAFRSLRPGGRLFINEVLLDANRGGPALATSYDLAMLLATSAGQQWCLRELEGLLARAGFAEVALAARAGAYTVVSATKPGA